MFIVFEGIDNSGKSTLSKKFLEYVNTPEVNRRVMEVVEKDQEDWVEIVLDTCEFQWTKEPQFTTEEADMLNSPEYKDEHKREAFFLSDRLRHQGLISQGPTVCDRYAWTGLAYAKKFSPNCYDFVKHVYTDDELMLKPDLYIFVDTPIDTCDERDPSVGKERLTSIRQAYLDTMDLATDPENLITMSAGGDVESSLNDLIEKFEAWLGSKWSA